MHIGVSNFPTAHSVDPAVLAKRAEELGFDSFWVPEHAIMPVQTTSRYPGSADGLIPEGYDQIADPFVALARASATTRTIELGTGICLVPEHNPLLLAKEIATLDHLSGGRYLFGIGAGWLQEETEIMGGNFPHRWTQTREAIEAMKELWTKDESEYHGEYYDFPLVRCYPKPARKPHPPIFLGGTSRNVFKRIVAWGDGWMPTRATPEEIAQGRETLNELAAQAGRDPKSIHVIAYSMPPDRETVKDYEAAGADMGTHRIAIAPEKEALAELEDIARKVL